jgi:replicative DNA helicase
MSVKLFISYSHKDETFKSELESHLAPLKNQGLIDAWSDRKIVPGEEIDRSINASLTTADIVLLIVSADFFQSVYCWQKELEHSLRRHEAHEAVVIPIVVRAVDLEGAPFAGLASLPADRRPVATWGDRDEAWTNVAKGIRTAVDQVRDRQRRLEGSNGRLSPVIQARRNRTYPDTGLKIGYTRLDYLLSGLLPSELVVVGGRPTMGKTSFVLNVSLNVAFSTDGPVPVAIFTPENSAAATENRLIASLARVGDNQIRAGRLQEDSWSRIDSALSLLAKAPLFVDESASLTPKDIETRATELKSERGLGLIVVDSLQMLRPNGRGNQGEPSDILRELKAVGRDLECTIFVTSQINRQVDRRVNKRPMLIDLPADYRAEEYADVVMLLYREEVYDQASTRPGIVDVVVAKNRKGDTGEVNLVFSPTHGKLDDYVAETSPQSI